METTPLNISNFPLELKEKIIQRADANKRSMQGEIIYILLKVIEQQLEL